MEAGLLLGNSRSFTPIFVVVLAVLLVGFRAYLTEIGDIQGVNYSCFFWRYLRARVQALLNMRKFLKVRKSLLSLF